ncbi:7SK snRNA methylphosphate capping enzyme-like isoform X2 [Stigmatopora argus]
MMSLDKSEKVSLGRPPSNGQSALAVPPQRLPRKRYSVGVAYKRPAKRRRRVQSDSQMEHLLPSHFLLGGNIFDPLNLNSLLDEDVNRVTNQTTPKCSPLPSRSRDPVDILVPRDITDPLNLKAEGKQGQEADGVLLSPLKSRRRHRNHHGGDRDGVTRPIFPSSDGLTVPASSREGSGAVSPLPCELNTAITCREDVALPPILPRRHSHPPLNSTRKSGERRRRGRRRTTSLRSTCAHVSEVAQESEAAHASEAAHFRTPLAGPGPEKCPPEPPREKDRRRYRHGNCCRYYGYRGLYGNGWEGRVGPTEDARFRLLRDDWFREKTVLDVGCGAGHLALAVARSFDPAHVLGVELDGRLVRAARHNIRHFLSHDLAERERRRRSSPPSEGAPKKEDEAVRLLAFPLSLRGDYVSEREAWPGRGLYDVILCLGVTKWVHLHAGDQGVSRLFRRAYQSLSPGGLFILEPQPWPRYARAAKASPTAYRHYKSLQVRPEHFTSYLTENVGFSSYRLLTRAGEKRPIYLFRKKPAATAT